MPPPIPGMESQMNSPMRILLVDNLMIRRYGNLRMGPGRKLACGAVRNDWRICEFAVDE